MITRHFYTLMLHLLDRLRGYRSGLSSNISIFSQPSLTVRQIARSIVTLAARPRRRMGHAAMLHGRRSAPSSCPGWQVILRSSNSLYSTPFKSIGLPTVLIMVAISYRSDLEGPQPLSCITSRLPTRRSSGRC